MGTNNQKDMIKKLKIEDRLEYICSFDCCKISGDHGEEFMMISNRKLYGKRLPKNGFTQEEIWIETFTHTHTHTYIYRERERKREREIQNARRARMKMYIYRERDIYIRTLAFIELNIRRANKCSDNLNCARQSKELLTLWFVTKKLFTTNTENYCMKGENKKYVRKI